jgi:hypothetical protein
MDETMRLKCNRVDQDVFAVKSVYGISNVRALNALVDCDGDVISAFSRDQLQGADCPVDGLPAMPDNASSHVALFQHLVHMEFMADRKLGEYITWFTALSAWLVNLKTKITMKMTMNTVNPRFLGDLSGESHIYRYHDCLLAYCDAQIREAEFLLVMLTNKRSLYLIGDSAKAAQK